MPPFIIRDLENVSVVLNAQPHIHVCADNLEVLILSRALVLDDSAFGYRLQPKSFKLEPKELLLYIFQH